MHFCLLLLSSFKTRFGDFAQHEAFLLATSSVLHICQAQCQDALPVMVLSAAKFPVRLGFALLLYWLIHHVTLTFASSLHVGSSAMSHPPPTPPPPHTQGFSAFCRQCKSMPVVQVQHAHCTAHVTLRMESPIFPTCFPHAHLPLPQILIQPQSCSIILPLARLLHKHRSQAGSVTQRRQAPTQPPSLLLVSYLIRISTVGKHMWQPGSVTVGRQTWHSRGQMRSHSWHLHTGGHVIGTVR